MKRAIPSCIFLLAFLSFWAFVCYSLPAQAQVVAVIPWIGDGNHQAHDYSFRAVQIPNGVGLARVVIDGGGKKGVLNGVDRVDFDLFLSRDGGLTFIPVGGETFNAGKQFEDFAVSLADPPGTISQARVLTGRAIVYGGSIKFRADVELE